MTSLLKGHEDYIVTHTRKEIMQKFNVNYSCVNYFCIKNGLKPIADRGKYRITDEMKDFLKEHTVEETASKFHVGCDWLSGRKLGGHERQGRIKIGKKRLFIVITGRNFANKTQKSAFFY